MRVRSFRQTRGRAQERHEQDVRVRQAGRRVAGHAEKRRAARADAGERGRLAWLHGDAVKDHLALRGDEIDDQIALADGASAGEDDDVRAGAGVERVAERVDGVLHGRPGVGDAAIRFDDRGQREPVDVVDLAGRRADVPARRLRCPSTGWRRGAARTPSTSVPSDRGDRADATRGSAARPDGPRSLRADVCARRPMFWPRSRQPRRARRRVRPSWSARPSRRRRRPQAAERRSRSRRTRRCRSRSPATWPV